MYVSIQRMKDVPDSSILEVSEFCVSSEFLGQYRKDSAGDTPRVLNCHDVAKSSLFLVKHSSFSAGEADPTSLNLTHVARYGLLDMFSIGLSTNHMSLLYWAIRPVVPALRWTDYGLLVMTRPPDPNTDIEIYTTTDGMVVCGDADKFSSVLALETLKFQPT